MTKQEFTSLFKNLRKDISSGYYGEEEMIDELWDVVASQIAVIKKLEKRLEKIKKAF